MEIKIPANLNEIMDDLQYNKKMKMTNIAKAMKNTHKGDQQDNDSPQKEDQSGQ